MLLVCECADIPEKLCDFVDGALPAEIHKAVGDHLVGCPECRARVKAFKGMKGLLDGALAAPGLSPDFDARTGQRLQAITTGPRLQIPGLAPEAAAATGFGVTLARRFHAVPWWAISGAFHALLLLLLTLIASALNRNVDDVVITTDLARPQPPAETVEPVKRDLFRNPVPMQAAEVEVQTPMVELHEEVQVAEHAETENDSNLESARGDESALADVSLGGKGAFASIGLGGGGGGKFGQRLGNGRRRLALKQGGSEKTESAVEAGLAWLARVQEADGRWDSKKWEGCRYPADKCSPERVDAAVTGMALLAFLGAGHTEKVGRYKDNVRRAVEWLRKKQLANGTLTDDAMGGYGHAIAGMALSEAAAMGRVAETREAAQRAADRTCGAGTAWEELSERGGWSYQPYQRRDVAGDISNSGWHIMFVKSAKVAGLHVNPATIEGLTKYLDGCERGKKEGDEYGGHLYSYAPQVPGMEMVTPTRTAIGILCRQFFGTPPEQTASGVKWMIDNGGLPDAPHGNLSLYYWYYGTLVCFQQGGEVWNQWNEALKAALLPTQVKDGGVNDGSWESRGDCGTHWGRVGQTAMAILCLEVYYRYLPMYR
ncbi:MAG: zf-HC2 domain-containing protein [Planctomycetota bacterium]|nr:zf-HC2 domain-containing protein [Planctomycetota bacterium]